MTRTLTALVALALLAPAPALANNPLPGVSSEDYQEVDVGGTVLPTLSLTLGTPVTFGTFEPGMTQDYTATTSGKVISTAGNGLLSVADHSSIATGRLVNGAYSLVQLLRAGATSPAGTPVVASGTVGGSASPTALLSYDGPVSNDVVTIAFKQSIDAAEALRSGTYGKTLTFTLSTTRP
jgi:hypothetical protein